MQKVQTELVLHSTTIAGKVFRTVRLEDYVGKEIILTQKVHKSLLKVPDSAGIIVYHKKTTNQILVNEFINRLKQHLKDCDIKLWGSYSIKSEIDGYVPTETSIIEVDICELSENLTFKFDAKNYTGNLDEFFSIRTKDGQRICQIIDEKVTLAIEKKKKLPELTVIEINSSNTTDPESVKKLAKVIQDRFTAIEVGIEVRIA